MWLKGVFGLLAILALIDLPAFFSSHRSLHKNEGTSAISVFALPTSSNKIGDLSSSSIPLIHSTKHWYNTFQRYKRQDDPPIEEAEGELAVDLESDTGEDIVEDSIQEDSEDLFADEESSLDVIEEGVEDSEDTEELSEDTSDSSLTEEDVDVAEVDTDSPDEDVEETQKTWSR